MELADEIQAIDQLASPVSTSQSDNLFLYGVIGVLVLLGIWIIFTFVSVPSQLRKIEPAPDATPMLSILKDPRAMIPVTATPQTKIGQN